MIILTKFDNCDKWLKTKMLEFGANFIGHMKLYEIPITSK